MDPSWLYFYEKSRRLSKKNGFGNSESIVDKQDSEIMSCSAISVINWWILSFLCQYYWDKFEQKKKESLVYTLINTHSDFVPGCNIEDVFV